MQGVLPNPYFQKLEKYRRIAYIIVITAGLLLIFSEPIKACADLFGYYVPDVYDEITRQVKDTNEILRSAFLFSKTSPYDIVNTLSGQSNGVLATRIIDASKTTALVVATILLMIEFVRKSANFEWSSKWENILLFLIKILIIKQVIQNADTIISYMYGFFDYINDVAVSNTNSKNAPTFLPESESRSYTVKVGKNILRAMHKGWWEVVKAGFLHSIGDTETYTYDISLDAVKMFYPRAYFPDMTEFESVEVFDESFGSPIGKMNFFPTLEFVKLMPLFLIMKAIAYIVFVVVIGRVFELTVYTIFAPLPLATFASETTHEVGKNFLKNYIATVLQIAVIAVMFILFSAMNTYLVDWMADNGFGAFKLINFINLCVLGLGVVKSGTWAKKICGIA